MGQKGVGSKEKVVHFFPSRPFYDFPSLTRLCKLNSKIPHCGRFFDKAAVSLERENHLVASVPFVDFTVFERSVSTCFRFRI